jgi:uncharacterized protein (UPF0332 family)
LPESEEGPLARARRELDEARALADAGFHRIACAQAYYAAFYAVEDAQATTGERVSKSHGGAVAALGRMAAAVNDVRPAASSDSCGRAGRRSTTRKR